MQKIFYIAIDFPFTLLRDITIPCCDETKWNKNIFIFTPIICPFFLLLITESNIRFNKLKIWNFC